jgi:hypothetical protein
MASEAASYPSTVSEFNTRFPNHATNTIHTLPEKLQNASGSNWKVQHLEACRVIVRSYKKLPILKTEIDIARKTLDACSEVTDLTKLSITKIGKMSHTELRANGGVFDAFYVALADVLRLQEPIDPTDDRPQRDCKGIHRPEYDSGEGLSSPASVTTEEARPRHPSSSPWAPQSDDSSDYDSQLDRIKPEVFSADLAAQFISSVLDRLSNQISQDSRIEFYRAPSTFKLNSATFSCTCQDDGSMVRREKNYSDHKWSNPPQFLCSLEAKPRYFQADASGQGIVSDRVIAQQVCEMLGSVMSSFDDETYTDLKDGDRW